MLLAGEDVFLRTKMQTLWDLTEASWLPVMDAELR